MVTFDELQNTDLGSLDGAASDFEALVRNWDLSTQLQSTVIGTLQGCGWTGPAAEACAGSLTDVRNQIDMAFEEASGLAKALRDAHTEFAGAQKALQTAVQSGTQEGLTIDSSGAVHWPPATNDADKNDPQYGPTWQGKADGIHQQIQAALDRATTADQGLAYTVGADTGISTQSFNCSPVAGLEAGEVKQAADLLSLGSKATDAQVAQLNAILKAHANDPQFNTDFYNTLGPEGFLKSYGAMGEYSFYGTPSKDALTQLQSNLGTALASATNTQNVPHLSDAWEAGLRKAGATQYQLLPDQLQGGNLYGYQILSNILRTGNYDAHFLQPIAEHMTQLSEQDPSMWEDAVIKANPLQQTLFLGPGDGGLNPMSGMLEALGHSPDAATKFFSDHPTLYNQDGTVKAVTSDSNNYLAKLTDPGYNSVLQDITTKDATQGGKACDLEATALGHALEAATIGQPYNAEGVPYPLHTPAMTSVMNQVVHQFGSSDGPTLITGNSAVFHSMNTSLGHMTAAYMGEVQTAFNGTADKLPLYETPADPSNPQPQLDPSATARLLGALGHDPDAYGTIAQAQQAYSTAHVHDIMLHASDHKYLDDAVSNAARPGGTVAALITGGKSDAIYQQHQQSDAAYNKAIDRDSGWAQKVWDMTGGGKVGDLPGGSAINTKATGIIQSVASCYKVDTNGLASDQVLQASGAAETGAGNAAQNAVLSAAQSLNMNTTDANDLASNAFNGARDGFDDGAAKYLLGVKN
ncbi:hypothetical protein P3T36_000745 [Kitasatospora sp. MAP12-15]|uniref:DUF6571 family protein n=1 Tax=unclassified Kitasatospora TaxID=2633591 RepID=UPI002474D381|nr:DUF6571 family protein [Kitasatospora sp. MAP12-44]MDH6114344.1 hypothetical protein [Kitasatospora sp. MAP12-44]